MKSEERHRLQETELEKLGRQAQQYWESFGKNYLKFVLIGVAVVCLIGGIVIWRLSVSASQKAEAWHAVLSATFSSDPANAVEAFATAAGNYSDQPAGHWAALMEAERALSMGIQTARTDRKASVQELVTARDAFNDLADVKSDLIQERRLFGLARTLEALAGVDVSDVKGAENVQGVEEAIEAYQLFLQRYPDSIFAPLAEDRITALETGRTQDFYAWYRNQNPTPEDLDRPDDGLPPGHPPVPGAPALPSGHPPLDGAPPSRPVTEQGLMQELEDIVNGPGDKPEQTGDGESDPAPQSTEEPQESDPQAEQPKGPALPAPTAEPQESEAGDQKPADQKPEENTPEPQESEAGDQKPEE